MNKNMYKRVIDEGLLLTKTNKTIREVANDFNISKSTVHKDLKERLPYIDPVLFKQVERQIKLHLATRHLKGGLSTKLKYKKIK